MDPLSLTASIVGVLAASAKVVKVLHTLKCNVADAPRSLSWTLGEITTMRASIELLADLLENLSTTAVSVRATIGLEALMLTLSETVLTFDELLNLVHEFDAGGDGLKTWGRAKWLLKQDDVAQSLCRMQCHKSSFMLVLGILQW